MQLSKTVPMSLAGFCYPTAHCKLVFSCREGPEKTVLGLGHWSPECVVLAFLQTLPVVETLLKAKYPMRVC